VIVRSPDYDPAFSLIDELRRRGLFEPAGRRETAPIEWKQPVREYVEQFHSTASLASELMSTEEAERFDEEVAALVNGHQNRDGTLTMRTTASVVWGRPLTGTDWTANGPGPRRDEA
jgi:hypothetical protein